MLSASEMPASDWSLDQLKAGDSAVVSEVICADKDLRNRLLSMGLVSGRNVRVTRIAPLGDPIKVELLGFNLSLRLDEAGHIRIRRK